MFRNWKLDLGICLVIVSWLLVISINGCGSSTETPATTTTTSSTTSTTAAPGSASITGQVAASSTDISALGISPFSVTKPIFRTLAAGGVPGAEVKLYQIASNGTETDTSKVATADASGTYTISNVDPLSSGVYKLVATKTGSSTTIEVTSLTVINTSTAETVNIAPESTIATTMFDEVIKEDFANIVVRQSTMKEFNNLVVDDTETLVNDGNLSLPSMTTDNSYQVTIAAEGIAENPDSNAKKAFKKLLLENMANNAGAEANLSSAKKYVNDLILNGSGSSYLIPSKVTETIAQAYLNGDTKTVAEVITAADAALPNTSLVSATIISSFETTLQNLKTKYDSLVAGTTSTPITEPEFLAFDLTQTPSINSSTVLDVGQQIILKDFIKRNFAPNETINDVTFAGNLGYITGTSPISTTEAGFDEVDVYYGAYGNWVVGGTVLIYIPPSSSATVSSVKLSSAETGAILTNFYEETANRRYAITFEATGPQVTIGSTYHYTIEATLSDASTITAQLTIEAINCPEPTMKRIDGTALENLDGTIPYYDITTVSDKKPILIWSTEEVASVTLPAGFSWAYSMEINRYGTTTTATLEINNSDATGVYNTGQDLGKLFNNASFIFPVEITSEVSGAKVAYKVYVQRYLLNAEGRKNGIAAGAFRFLRLE